MFHRLIIDVAQAVKLQQPTITLLKFIVHQSVAQEPLTGGSH